MVYGKNNQLGIENAIQLVYIIDARKEVGNLVKRSRELLDVVLKMDEGVEVANIWLCHCCHYCSCLFW